MSSDPQANKNIKSGFTLRKLGQHAEAIEYFDQELKINPDLAASWGNRGISLSFINRYAEAIDSYDHCLKIKPEDYEVWNFRGDALVKLCRYPEAIESYNRALKINPNYSMALHNRNLALTLVRCPACGAEVLSTKRFCRNCSAPLPESSVCPNCGAIVNKNAKFCKDCGREMGSENPEKIDESMEVEYFYTKGVRFSELGFLDDAVAFYDKALKINPNYPDAVYNRDIALSKLGQNAKAVANTSPGKIDEKTAEDYFNRGVAQEQGGRYDDAVASYDQALKFKPDDSDTLNNRNFTLGQLGKNAGTVVTTHPSTPETTTPSVTPDLEITLDQKSLTQGIWHKLQVPITNTGKAHAISVILSFSDDFQTRLIKPVTVEAGTTNVVEIGILPKTLGSIPIEVTMNYKDEKNLEYTKTSEFWFEVAEKGSITTSGINSTPAGQFTTGTTTFRQISPDLTDRYTEAEFIGKGGFARVFKAKRKDGKYIALKIPLSMDTSTGKSFIAEMQNWTKLSHPNIVKLYDFNIMPIPFFEEELCDSALSDQKKPIENEEAAWILFNICEGLKFAHARKIIHRDLKPQNILLKDGMPKISDWGLSKVISEASSTTATSFTPFYAAPEQIKNKPKDERTDIWQLGVILYELITGVLPFKGDSMFEIGMCIATKDPQDPGEIKPSAKVIESVVMKCMEKEPENRYQSVLELQKDLAKYLRKNYADLLSTSVSVQDYTRSASFCGDLIMINMLTGDIATAYKYILDLIQYTKGDVKLDAQELSDQLKMRMEMGITEIPPELIQKADLIVHQVTFGFRKRG